MSKCAFYFPRHRSKVREENLRPRQSLILPGYVKAAAAAHTEEDEDMTIPPERLRSIQERANTAVRDYHTWNQEDAGMVLGLVEEVGRLLKSEDALTVRIVEIDGEKDRMKTTLVEEVARRMWAEHWTNRKPRRLRYTWVSLPQTSRDKWRGSAIGEVERRLEEVERDD